MLWSWTVLGALSWAGGEDVAADVEVPPAVEADAEPQETNGTNPSPYPLLWPGQVTPESAEHWDLEVLYHEGRHEEGLRLAEQRRAADPTHAELAWMIARFLFEIGERFERDDAEVNKEAHYKRMWKVVDRALEAHPDDPHLRFARGIAIGRYGTTRGVLASLFLAKDVERDWLFAAESGLEYASIGAEEHLPCDVYQALGIYYRLVPEWWIVKVLAGTRGDLDKSLAWHEKGNACAPRRIRNLKELGVTQICMGQRRRDDALVEQGKATLQQMLDLTARTETERIDHRHGRMLLGKLDLACEYSRDGQQDLDEGKLDR